MYVYINMYMTLSALVMTGITLYESCKSWQILLYSNQFGRDLIPNYYQYGVYIFKYVNLPDF